MEYKKITKVSKNSQNNLETIANENDIKIITINNQYLKIVHHLLIA